VNIAKQSSSQRTLGKNFVKGAAIGARIGKEKVCPNLIFRR